MAKILVEIDLPNVPASEITNDSEWFERGKILIDDAYLKRAREDDSFFEFEFRGIQE